jgi:hypothetical protein
MLRCSSSVPYVLQSAVAATFGHVVVGANKLTILCKKLTSITVLLIFVIPMNRCSEVATIVGMSLTHM